jgi:acetyltransferase-like isoleucine patch superfamily enzyme
MLASLLFHLYKIPSLRLRHLILYLVPKLEGGPFYSKTLRRIFREFDRVDVGLYTHGGCFTPGAIDRETTIGRYCSIASGVRILTINHPLDFKSTHAFFFNPKLGYCGKELVEYNPISVGNDVWMGHNSIVMPNVKQIGDGAVIAAGAVVNKDVPPFAVVVGNPARVVRFRFPPDVIGQLLVERWWDKPIEELDLNEYTRHFLKKSASLVEQQEVLPD